MSLRRDTGAVINRATRGIAIWPTEEWALWATYLLMNLEKHAEEDDEYRTFLKAVQCDIDRRLTEETW